MSTQEAFAFGDEPTDAPAAPADVVDVVADHVADDVIDLVELDAPDELDEPAAEPIVEIRASARRRRTVTAYREGDRTIVLVPARMSLRERERHAAELVERLAKREARGRRTDEELMTRARQLSRRWFDGKAKPSSVRWVSNQRTRWGSCTPIDGTIRLSDRLRGMPPYVVDSVLLHELAHLVHADHSPQFWALLEPIPDQERAKAYLEGVEFGRSRLSKS